MPTAPFSIPPAGATAVSASNDVRSQPLLAARRGLPGLLFSGLLTACLGAILPAWRYHIEPNFLLIGTYFLCQNLGIILAPLLGAAILKRRGLASGLALGCAAGAAGLLILSYFSPPAPWHWRMGGLFLVGFGAGLINTSAFHAITPAYRIEAAVTLNLGGALYNIGAFLAALIVAASYFSLPPSGILLVLALLPMLAVALYARTRLPADTDVRQPTLRQAFSEFKSPAAFMFAALLFFQFGNEGVFAGWLAIFLIQKLGVSPVSSLLLLALFWFALLIGRVIGQWLLSRVRHGRLLVGATFAPMFACLVLSLTDNMFGAISGVLIAAGGFAFILPLVFEKIGHRFPQFHPGFFNGIFSLAVTGGLLAPASLGYFAHFLGIEVIMTLPLLGSVAVFILQLLILLESKISGRRLPSTGGATSA